MARAYPAKLTSKGQLTLPSVMRAALKLRPGDHVKFVQDASGKFWVEPMNATLADLKGALGEGKKKFSSRDVEDLILEARRARGAQAIGKGMDKSADKNTEKRRDRP